MRGYLAGIGLAAAVGLLAFGAEGRAEDKQTALLEIRPETTERSTRLLLEANGPLTYTYYSPDPLTLVLDIPEVDGTKVPAKINVASPEVESVRVTGMSRADGRTLTRVEVRLASLSPYHVFTRDNRLTVEFDRALARAEGEPASEAPAPVAAPSVAGPPLAEAPVAAAPAPAPPRTARHAATTVTSITHGEEGGQLAVTITADGPLAYEDFFLANPDRLVVDLSGVTVVRRNLVIEKDPVRKVRIAQFSTAKPLVGRLVLDLARKTPYRIVEASDGVKILFDRGGVDRGGVSLTEPLAAMRPVREAEELLPPVTASSLNLMPPLAPQETVIAPSRAVVAAPALMAVPALPAEGTGSSGFEVRGLTPDEKKYTGHPISMDFKDGDLLDIFRLFADISGLNVIINPGVQGKVTLKLTEVPWDQALDLILKTQGLGYKRDDTVIRIARLNDLQREEAERRKLQDEAELAGQLTEVLKRISYAKAKDLADVVKKSGAISRRGTIHIDERTNTIIIKDLPTFLDRSKSLIAELDRPTRQVEIEARVVVTKRNFARDVGVQWGLLNQKTPAYGSALNQGFPNTITIGGRRTGEDPGASPVGGAYMVNLPATGSASGIGVTMGSITGGLNLDAALTALEKQGRGRILSTPKITTQDNKEAEIKQGYQLPILVEQNNTVTLVYKDATLTLKVTPQITEASTVILNLTLENNKPDFSVTVRGAPAIQIQEAKTVLLVNDGDTAVVGGVYSTSESTGMTYTPFFAKIPILGYLFQERNRTQENQELMLFITPHITKS